MFVDLVSDKKNIYKIVKKQTEEYIKNYMDWDEKNSILLLYHWTKKKMI